MSTTVRIWDEDKRDLDKLQARIRLAGQKASLEETLHRVIQAAKRHSDEVTGTRFLTQKEVDDLLALKYDGDEVGPGFASELDKEIYEEKWRE